MGKLTKCTVKNCTTKPTRASRFFLCWKHWERVPEFVQSAFKFWADNRMAHKGWPRVLWDTVKFADGTIDRRWTDIPFESRTRRPHNHYQRGRQEQRVG